MKKNKKGVLLFLMSVVFGGFLGGFVENENEKEK